MWTLFIEFEIDNNDNFGKFQEMFNDLRDSKNKGELDCEDARWIDYYDDEQIEYFWWPTQEEEKAYWELFNSLPFDQVTTDERLKKPWDFESMIDAIRSGEYDLASCNQTCDNIGRLEFDTWSWPYGGAGALKALIESFGFKITHEEL